MRLPALILSTWILASTGLSAREFSIVRIHYDGGGDWYSDPSSLPNLLRFLQAQTGIKAAREAPAVQITSEEFHNYPYLYLTGHGNIRFSETEVTLLREFLLQGAFLHADDNYGMDASFRREMKRVFPDKEFVELPHDHPIYHCFFDLPQGLPKVHEHDGQPPRGLGLFHEDRLIVFYSYESDLGDGWEDESVHQDPWPIREKALQMGVNILWYMLTQ